MIDNTDPSTHTNLTDKIKQLEILNYMMAHNLRGSAANIKMLSDVLIGKNIPDDCHAQEDDDIFTTGEAIRHINESSISLLSTLGSLMEVADIELNDTIKYDLCDIAFVVKHITSQLGGFIQEKDAAIELCLELTHVEYPMPYMESILYNFINNSLKYCRSDVPLKITISTYQQSDRRILSVKDNGLGIDLKAHGRKIFNLYQVFHAGYQSKGMGLYIIKRQIESLGGSVSVKSKVNEGCEFIVVF